MSAPDSSALAHDAVYRDGTSSRKRLVMLRFGDRQIEILEDGAVVGTWIYADIRRADGPQGMRVRSVSALPLARLDIENNAVARELASRCPSLDVAQTGRNTGRIVVWSLAAAASIVLVTLYGIPVIAERLASLLPLAVEQRFGEAVDKQVRFLFPGKVCEQAEGKAAFATMIEKLRDAGGLALPLTAEVSSSSVVNAFALPGGKVYLFDGLLQKARSPDEVAGVIAHELGHVQHRDGLRKTIQAGGTSFLIGLLLGDITGGGAVIFATRSVLDASYSRDAENDADAFAVAVMHKLGRSPRPMGEFLVRVTGEDKKRQTATILDSHPMSAERLKRMTEQDRPVTGPDILTPAQWQALKTICK